MCSTPLAGLANQMTLGSFIRQKRVMEDFTQTELAGALGVSPSQISRIERDKTIPLCSLMIRIAKVLAIDERDMLICAALTALTRPVMRDGTMDEIVRILREKASARKLNYRSRNS